MNCSCRAYAYESGIRCLVWGVHLVDVHVFSSGGNDMYLWLAASELETKKKMANFTIAIIVLAAVFALGCVYLLFNYKRRARSRGIAPLNLNRRGGDVTTVSAIPDETEDHKCPELPLLSFESIITCTSNFSRVNLLGEGGFGPVYKECRERGIKLSGGTSAAAMVATYASKHFETDQYENYSVVTLVDCRKYLNPVLHDHNIRFYHSAILNTQYSQRGGAMGGCSEMPNFLYSNALDNNKHLKDMGGAQLPDVQGHREPPPCPFFIRGLHSSVFDEPVVYESSKLQQKFGVEDNIGCASIHGVGPAIAVFDTIRDGQLDCTCVYPSPLHSRKQIEELVEHMKRLLVGGATNGESQEIEKSTV